MGKTIEFNEYQQKLVSWFEKINQEFNDSNINWFPIGGTLLGVINYNNILPWDDDIDMLISPDEFFLKSHQIKHIANRNNSTFLDTTKNETQNISMIVSKEAFSVKYKGRVVKMKMFVDIFIATNNHSPKMMKVFLSLKEKRTTTTSKFVFSNKKNTWYRSKAYYFEKASAWISNILLLPKISTILVNKYWYKREVDLSVSNTFDHRTTKNSHHIDITKWTEANYGLSKVKVPIDYQQYLNSKFGKFDLTKNCIKTNNCSMPHIEKWRLTDRGY